MRGRDRQRGGERRKRKHKNNKIDKAMDDRKKNAPPRACEFFTGGRGCLQVHEWELQKL